ncbi:MAG: 4-alpha-glucanotransferase [Bradymonadaceae bacterium]
MPDLPRSSGILMHPSSLPGRRGIGEIGRTALDFGRCLTDAGQQWWQLLPLNPPGWDASPYASYSAFAGNPLLLDLESLCQRGWLSNTELNDLESACAELDEHRYPDERVNPLRRELLESAYQRWNRRGRTEVGDFEEFCSNQADWLDDHALFVALRDEHGGADWRQWPPALVERRTEALDDARDRLAAEIECEKFLQWRFDRQWRRLRGQLEKEEVEFIGDVPIFVSMDSADVWANRELFRIDRSGVPEGVAGVPPDYFSETGQKWGNPLYDWDAHAEDDFEWWRRRLERTLATVSLARIDHFRGFEAYWEVPPEAPTAETGQWRDGPGDTFFETMREHFDGLPFVAEDLGTIGDEVRELRDRHELPGMRVIQFAFTGDPDHPFLPENYPRRTVAYTGTHDNDTTVGWYRDLDDQTRRRVDEYVSKGAHDGPADVMWELIDAISASEAAMSIFPVQDILELGSDARMNTPGTEGGNWAWRMTAVGLRADGWERLAEITGRHGR